MYGIYGGYGQPASNRTRLGLKPALRAGFRIELVPTSNRTRLGLKHHQSRVVGLRFQPSNRTRLGLKHGKQGGPLRCREPLIAPDWD